MTNKLDITGKVCPFCLLAVDKELKKLPSGEELVVVCDHAPAATASIPEYCENRNIKWKSLSLRTEKPNELG